MPIIIPNDQAPQGGSEWLGLRLGVVTGSDMKRIITNTGSPSKSADGYMNELIYEILSGMPAKNYKSEWMKRGNELEPESRAAYEFVHDTKIQEVSFVFWMNAVVSVVLPTVSSATMGAGSPSP